MKGKLTKAFLFGTIGSLILWIMFMVMGAICAIWQGGDILPKFFRTGFSYGTLTVLASSMCGLLAMSFISTMDSIAKDFNTLLGTNDTKDINGLVGKQIIISRDDDARRENHKQRKELRNATDEMEYLHEKLEAQMRKQEEDTDKAMEVASCHMMPNDAYLGVECATNGTAYFGRWLAIITFRDGTVYKRVVNDKYQEEFNASETFRDAEATNCLKDAKKAKAVVTKFRRHIGSSSRQEAAQAFLAECRKRPGFKLGEEARSYLTQLAGNERMRKARNNDDKTR